MTWSKFDDGYDEHEKVLSAWFATPPNAVGLHVLATTVCNRRLSDGVVPPTWLQTMLPPGGRWRRHYAATLDAAVTSGLFDVLDAGSTAQFVDIAETEIVVGPFPEARYLVHDFLDRHESSVTVKTRRAAKQRSRARERVRPPARVGAPASRPDPTRPDRDLSLLPQQGSEREIPNLVGLAGEGAA